MKNTSVIHVGGTNKALYEFLCEFFLFSGRLLELRSTNCKADSKCLTSLVRILRKYDFRRERPERDRKRVLLYVGIRLDIMYPRIFNAINYVCTTFPKYIYV